MLLSCKLALAEEAIKYDPGSAPDVLKNVAGGVYVLLIAIFAVRLLRKRAKFATEQVRGARAQFWSLQDGRAIADLLPCLHGVQGLH
jgi:hypothetical protein